MNILSLKDEIKCDLCYRFIKTKNYEWHKMKHLKYHIESYKCGICDYETPRKDNLKRHEALKHDLFNKDFDALRENEASKHQTYKCPECKKKFDTVKKVEDHLVLSNCKEIICDLCNKKFTLKHNLTKNLKKIHKIKDP